MKTLGKLFLALSLLGAVCSAQTHPNFTGTWKLNAEKSDPGSSGVTALVVDVTHKDPALSYTVKGTAGGQTSKKANL